MVYSDIVTQSIGQYFSYPLDFNTSYQFEDTFKKDFDKSHLTTYYRDKIHTDNFKYFEIIKLYKELFDNVHVFLYEDFVKNPKEFVNSLEELLEDNFNNKEDINFKKTYRKSMTDLHLQHQLYLNKLYSFTNKKALIYPLYIFFKLTRRKSISLQPFFNKIQDCFKENNNLIVKYYPEIGVQNYPEKYQL